MHGGIWMHGGVPLRREVRRQFWLLIRARVASRKAALALGLDDDTGRDWFRRVNLAHDPAWYAILSWLVFAYKPNVGRQPANSGGLLR